MSAYTQGLRDLADFLDANPEFVGDYAGGLDVPMFVYSREDLIKWGRLLGGTRTKSPVGGFYEIARKFGPHSVSVNIARDDVCRRVVVGIREVPAREASTEEIVEWVCDDPVILGVAS